MFTGLVDHRGELVAIQPTAAGQGRRLQIRSQFGDLQLGESIAVNGICLTVTDAAEGVFACDVSSETLACTTAGAWQVGKALHLERALRMQDRLGGHWVTGHVDGVLQLHAVTVEEGCLHWQLSGFSQAQQVYLLPKGSLAVDGVSLTINAVDNDCVALLLIPETLRKTAFAEYNVGDHLNIEFDYLAKLVVHSQRFQGEF